MSYTASSLAKTSGWSISIVVRRTAAGWRWRKLPSYSSASATNSSPPPDRAEAPQEGMSAPTSTVGSCSAATRRWPRSAVVVDLPWVPATATPSRPRSPISSPRSACHGTTGIRARGPRPARAGPAGGEARRSRPRGRPPEVARIVAGEDRDSGFGEGCVYSDGLRHRSHPHELRRERQAGPFLRPRPAMPMTWMRSPAATISRR